MSQEQLQAELDKALVDLEDLEELRRGFLGQTGVHIGMRVLKSVGRQFEQEETRLKERIALLKKLSGMEQVFDDYVERYDAWYDTPVGQAVLDIEFECLRPLLNAFPRPHLEVGVGTGRFAQALGIEYGVDPSIRALEKAQSRGVRTGLGTAETIPFGDAAFGAVLMAFTLCFVQDPHKAMSEISRVLLPGGGLVLGLLPRGTPWADSYARRGAEGHPLYRAAHFFSREEVEALLQAADFQITAYRSTLFQGPDLEVYEKERAVDGWVSGGGFVGLAAVKAQE